MDIGFETIVKEYPGTEYLIILASDCWLTNPEPMLNIIDTMKTEGYKVATSIWGEKDSLLKDKGFATDFFIVDVEWANKYKLFPFRYEEFSNKHREILWYMSVVLMVEKLALLRFTEAIYNEEPSINKIKKNIAEKLLLIKDRDPIYQEKDQYGGWSLRNTYPEIGLINHHNPYKKRKAIKELNFAISTPVFSNFINNEDLSDFVADEVQKKPVNN